MTTTAARPGKKRPSTSASGDGGAARRASAKPPKPDAKPAAARAPGSKPAGGTADPAAEALKELKKKELVEAVVTRSGIKKKYVKPAVDAIIAILGEAISEGRDVNLQPLGKITRKRAKDTGNALVTTARIRQSKTSGDATDAGGGTQEPKAKETVADAVE